MNDSVFLSFLAFEEAARRVFPWTCSRFQDHWFFSFHFYAVILSCERQEQKYVINTGSSVIFN